MDVYFQNPNPFSGVDNIPPPLSSDFINVSDYLVLDDDVVANPNSNWSLSSETPESSDKAGSINDINVINQGFSDEIETSINNNSNNNMNIKRKSRGMNETTVEVTPRVTFRTRSQFEIMDDGYKWRKYGKKFVKNNSNPRNYYKCSCEGCGVKKRVERDREDTRYVLTSYDGVHNHESPCTLSYYAPPTMSLVYSNEWQLQQQASANSSSSNYSTNTN
ncbi:probable WRKY transcription factor 50 [Lathyrus oleraceus]|uniref:WRKY domain-containing protein n=2 Tax=Pisum sativum TaxID=3888 RepID=A0A9D5AGY8_PEA|nr:probable WRKY transcription factor 50 [Pisum sativum]KAI5405170.1 hypothetical protein KIW84_052085 [Pisum sativum]